MNIFTRLILVCGLLVSLGVNAQLAIKNYNLDYRNNSTAYIYAGIKSNIKLNSLPYDADYIQVVVINNPEAPRARIIGSRKMKVNKGNESFVEFVFEMDDVDKQLPFVSSIELKIKAFSEIKGKYEIVDKISMFIRPIICNGQDDEVCALIKTRCHSGNPKCIEREVARTFKSKCEADKFGADVLYGGACSS